MMNTGIVVLFGDFCQELLYACLDCGIQRLGLHFNIEQNTMAEYCDFIVRNRKLIRFASNRGIKITHYLHAVSSLLPRTLFVEKPQWFRMDETGKRTPDLNLCSSSDDALMVIEKNAENLAKFLEQETREYHFWTDDDFGKDVFCHCGECCEKDCFNQNRIIYRAVLRGLKKYDFSARLSYLDYGKSKTERLDKDMFLEYAPFLRRHDLPIESQDNIFFKNKSLCISKNYKNTWSVLEYFLSYDYASVCSGKQEERIRQDISFYKTLKPYALDTFAVFPNRLKNYDGIKKYAAWLRS